MNEAELSEKAQAGLCRWAADIEYLPASWEQTWLLLCAAEDRIEWFPCGKWATLQYLEELIEGEASWDADH